VDVVSILSLLVPFKYLGWSVFLLLLFLNLGTVAGMEVDSIDMDLAMLVRFTLRPEFPAAV
jgi:hypothetical protein